MIVSLCASEKGSLLSYIGIQVILAGLLGFGLGVGRKFGRRSLLGLFLLLFSLLGAPLHWGYVSFRRAYMETGRTLALGYLFTSLWVIVEFLRRVVGGSHDGSVGREIDSVVRPDGRSGRQKH